MLRRVRLDASSRVNVTLRPKGCNVVLERNYGAPDISTIMSQAITNWGMRAVTAGTNLVALNMGIRKAARIVAEKKLWTRL